MKRKNSLAAANAGKQRVSLAAAAEGESQQSGALLSA
jgi:hypothetical protein